MNNNVRWIADAKPTTTCHGEPVYVAQLTGFVNGAEVAVIAPKPKWMYERSTIAAALGAAEELAKSLGIETGW